MNDLCEFCENQAEYLLDVGHMIQYVCTYHILIQFKAHHSKTISISGIIPVYDLHHDDHDDMIAIRKHQFYLHGDTCVRRTLRSHRAPYDVIQEEYLQKQRGQ